MKKTLLTLALVTASVAAFAQGKVSFGNDSLHYFVLGQTRAADVALGGGTSSTAGNTVNGAPGAIPVSPLPSGSTLYALLYAGTGTAGDNLVLQTSYALDAANWFQAGRMTSRGIILSGVAGATIATLSVVVADQNAVLGSAYLGDIPAGQVAPAAYNGLYYGSSQRFTMTPGASLSYPSIVSAGGTTWAAANLVINQVPEPSTFALAGLGAAALLIFRRRK